MATPHFNSLVLKLSQLLFDPRSAINESDTPHDFTQDILATVLNNAGRDMLNTIAEKNPPEVIAKALPEHIKEQTVSIVSGEATRPSNSLRGIAITGLNWIGLYTKPEDFRASALMNPEEEGTAEFPRWTEFDNTIYLSGIADINATYMYLHKYENVTIDGATDITIPDRLDQALLDLAIVHIEKLFPVNRGQQ